MIPALGMAKSRSQSVAVHCILSIRYIYLPTLLTFQDVQVGLFRPTIDGRTYRRTACGARDTHSEWTLSLIDPRTPIDRIWVCREALRIVGCCPISKTLT